MDLIKFTHGWDRLDKYQKTFIRHIYDKEYCGSLNGIMHVLGFKNNGIKFNNSIHELCENGIVLAEQSEKKIQGSGNIAYSYRLADNWQNVLIAKYANVL